MRRFWAILAPAVVAVPLLLVITSGASSAHTRSAVKAASNSGSSAPLTQPVARVASKNRKKWTIAFISGQAGQSYYDAMQCGVKTEAAKLGVSVTVQGPTAFGPSLEIPIVNAVSAKHPSAIIAVADDAHALYTPLKEARAAGAKIIVVNSLLANPDITSGEVTGNEYAGGETAADVMSGLIGGKGKVLVINLAPGIQSTAARVEGIDQGLKARHPGIDNLGTQFDGGDPTKAASIVSATLARDPDLKGIICTEFVCMEGVPSALRRAGLLGKVKVVGWDAQPPGMAQLANGEMNALIVGMPEEQGILATEDAVNALEGKPNPKMRITGNVVVTKANEHDASITPYAPYRSC